MELNQQDLQWAKEAIEKVGLFSTCSPEELQSLIDGLEKEHYKSGSTILFQGEISSRLCMVEAGKVEVLVRRGKSKEKVQVAQLGPNSYFGEISLLMPRAATATIKALDESDIVFLPGEVVQSLIKNNPMLSDNINKQIEARLASSKKQMDNDETEG